MDDTIKKWIVSFYRDEEKTDKYASCIVWEKSAQAAMSWSKGYFQLTDKTTMSAEEECIEL